jgi:hypothetical protein
LRQQLPLSIAAATPQRRRFGHEQYRARDEATKQHTDHKGGAKWRRFLSYCSHADTPLKADRVQQKWTPVLRPNALYFFKRRYANRLPLRLKTLS